MQNPHYYARIHDLVALGRDFEYARQIVLCEQTIAGNLLIVSHILDGTHMIVSMSFVVHLSGISSSVALSGSLYPQCQTNVLNFLFAVRSLYHTRSQSRGIPFGCGFFAYSWKLPAYSGAFLLTVDNFSFSAYNFSFFTHRFSFFTYSWSFLLTVGKCV